MTTEQVLEILTKVTTLPSGLFDETSSRTVGGLTAKNFYCDAESDDYTVLINAKGEIIEIKNSYNTWNQVGIKNLLNPPVQPPPPSNNIMTTGSGFQPVSQTFQNMPGMNLTFSFASMYPTFTQFIADFVKANPGCIYTQIDPANPNCVNEATAHLQSAWVVRSISGDGDQIDIDFSAENCTDTVIAGNIAATVTFDAKTNVPLSVDITG